MKISLLTLILAAAPAFAGMQGYSTDPGWQQITGDASCIKELSAVIVKDAQGFDELWARHTCGLSEAPQLPPADFSSERVIAVFLGHRTSAGYKVELDLNETAGDPPELVVSFREKAPDQGSFQAGFMSQPWVLRKVKNTYAAVRFPAGIPTSVSQAKEEKPARAEIAIGTRLQESGLLAELGGMRDAPAANVSFDGAADRALSRGNAASTRRWDAAVKTGALPRWDANVYAASASGMKLAGNLPPPPGKKKQEKGKLPPPPGKKKQEGKKLPPPPKKQEGKKLPPPPGTGKPLPPPPGVSLPTPIYPGGPLPSNDRRLENADRTYSSYGKRYIGYWRGDRYYKSAQARLKRGPEDIGETFSVDMTSIRVRKYFLFYYNPSDKQISWMPVEKEIDRKSRQLIIEFTNDTEKPMMPWEGESFVFSLAGNTVSLDGQNGSYRYSVLFTVDPSRPSIIVAHLTAGEKLRTSPDRKGVTAGIQGTGGGLKLVIRDKWAEEYDGEYLEVRYVIRRDDGKWYSRDDIVQKATSSSPLRFQAASVYEHEIMGGLAAKSGKFYLESWSFRRAGSAISTSRWIGKGKGNTITK